MRKRWPRWMLPVLFLAASLSGCASPGAVEQSATHSELAQKAGLVEKVSVLSTDGQEIYLDLQAFSAEFWEQGKQLEISAAGISQNEVKYTLILYRAVDAPLVIDIGEHSSQVDQVIYHGPGAENFYKWTHAIIGRSLFSQLKVSSLEISAEDQKSTLLLNQSETLEMAELLRQAEYRPEKEQPHYPLYPHYHLKLGLGEKTLDATLLTPSTLALQMGNEQFYYHVPGELFSRLTELIPPQALTAQTMDELFKASEVHLTTPGEPESTASGQVNEQVAPLIAQGVSHQVVRLLKEAKPVAKPKDPGAELFQLNFQLNQSTKTVVFFEQYFTYQGRWYHHSQLDQRIKTLMDHLYT